MRVSGRILLTSVLLAGAYAGSGRADPSGFDLLKSLDPAGFPEVPERIVGDQRGLRVADEFRMGLSRQTRITLETSEVTAAHFGGELTRTIENGTEFRVETLARADTLVTARIRSLLTHQAIEEFNGIIPERSQHRTYTLMNGWKRRLASDLAIEILAGVAHCAFDERGDGRFLPLGGVGLEHDFRWGDFTARFVQDAEGGGTLSGIYGAQLERRIDFRGRFDLGPGLKLLWDCGVMAAAGAFRSEGVLPRAAVVSGGMGLEFVLGGRLSGTVRYGHRRILGERSLAQGFEGPHGVASLEYRFN
jgi:hypothetical protein